MKSPGAAGHYSFESFRFYPATGELLSDGKARKLRPQASLALELLISRGGELVTRGELREALWPDERVVMFESSIAAVMRELRRALGDDPKAPRFVETIPKRGYRFVRLSDTAPTKTDGTATRRHVSQSAGGGFLRVLQGLALASIVLLPGSAENSGPAAVATHYAEPVTVAVLPFETLTPPSHNAMAEILPRDLVGWLGIAAPASLRVIDRTRGEGGAPPDFVLRGSVRGYGGDEDAVVVSARLLSGADGGFLWGEDYRRLPLDPDLTVREVSARIAESVLSSVVPDWSNGHEASVAKDAAVAHFRRGMKALMLFDPQRTNEAIDAFAQATQLDSKFHAAHAHLAVALINWVGPPLTTNRVEQARQAAQRSIELEPRNAVGYRVLGEIGLYFDRDWQLAGNRLERSVELAPSSASGHHSYAAWLSSRGRHDEALREIELAEALDPGSVAISIDAMMLHFYARDFDATIRAARRLQQLWPNSKSSHQYAVLSHLAVGDITQAAAKARAVLAGRNAILADSRAAMALSDSEALEAYWMHGLDTARHYVQQDDADPSFLSIHYIQLGQSDAAIDALEAAVNDNRFSYVLPYLGVSPAFDSLCGYPRFERILRDLRQSALNSESVESRCAAAIEAAALSPTRGMLVDAHRGKKPGDVAER
jgi:DNA-binding winged helix-turn-helix (wHTH) protein/tetratricopeptide (TPR) repeat protein/TolB-like protein